MVTEGQLEAAIRDFLNECKRIGPYKHCCLPCKYHSVCSRLLVLESNSPCDWTFYPKEVADDNTRKT